jgi:hypothetical protein
MTPEDQQTLDLLLKKQKEEAGAPVLQLIRGGGEQNAMAAKFEELVEMARRGEIFDYAVALVLQPGANGFQHMIFAWGSQVPSAQVLGAASALNFQLNAHLLKV